jgi:hypothetical protein
MFQITFNNGGAWSFESMEDLDTWLQENIARKSFGKNDRWKLEEMFDGDESIETATTTRQIDGYYGPVTEYFFPKEYTYLIRDISVEYAKKERINEKVLRGTIKREMSKKLLSYILDEMNDENESIYDNILHFLSKGNLTRAKSLIIGSQDITQDIKDDILFIIGE